MLTDLEQDVDVLDCARAAYEVLESYDEADHRAACAALASRVACWLNADGPRFNWLTPLDIETSGMCRGARVSRGMDGADRAYGLSSQGELLLEYLGEPIRSWIYGVDDGGCRKVVTWTTNGQATTTVAAQATRFSATAGCHVFASANAHGYEFRGAWRFEEGRSRVVYDWYELPPRYYRHPARSSRFAGVIRQYVGELAGNGSVQRVACTTTNELVWYTPESSFEECLRTFEAQLERAIVVDLPSLVESQHPVAACLVYGDGRRVIPGAVGILLSGMSDSTGQRAKGFPWDPATWEGDYPKVFHVGDDFATGLAPVLGDLEMHIAQCCSRARDVRAALESIVARARERRSERGEGSGREIPVYLASTERGDWQHGLRAGLSDAERSLFRTPSIRPAEP